MRRYKTKTLTQEASVLVEIRCDKCNSLLYECDGITVLEGHKSADSPRKLLPAQFKYEGQFGNQFDGQEWLAELCEQCAIAVFDFINNDLGSGVQIEELFPSAYIDPYQIDDYYQAPFDTTKQNYIGKSQCIYHPHLGSLLLTESGLKCSQPGCPTIETAILKKELSNNN
jgi:hypothetical protein